MAHKQSSSATWGGVKNPGQRRPELLETRKAGTDRRVRDQFHLAGVLVLVLCASLAFGKSSKIAKDLKDRDGDTVDVIVQYRVQPGKAHFDRVAAHGGTLKKDLRGAIHGAAFSV